MEEEEETHQDEGEIRCICGFTEDDGFTIQCEKCYVWQHAVCVSISASNVPEIYYCDRCDPRPLDSKKAYDIQYLRQKEESEQLESDDRRFTKRRRTSSEISMKEKKRVKEFNSPEVEERKRGRPRLHQVQVMVEAVPYSRKKVLDPLIRKIEVKDAQVRYSDSFESEYQQALVNFVDISSNRSSSLAQEEITEVCHSQWPFYYSKSNETVKSQLFNVSLGLKGIKSDSMLKSMLSSQKSSPVITMLYDDFPPTFYTAQQGLATPFISGAKQNALFATHTITSFSYITEIFGVISTTRDLDLMHDSHSIYPAVCAAKGVHKDISPLAKLILEKSSSSPLGKLLLEKSPLLGSLKLGTPVGSPVLSTGKISPTRDVQMTIMDSTPVRNENTFRSPSKTTKIGTTRNQSEFTIAPPFVFKLPTMSDNLWIDAREFSTNDGRSVRSVCKSCNNNNANAVLKLVVLKSLTDIKKSDPSISEIQSVDDLSDKQMSDLDKVHLCIFSTKPIQPGGEIILSSDDNILYYPCACAKNNCDSLENAFILDNFNRSRFRDDPDIPKHPLFETVTERETEREKTMGLEIESLNNQQFDWVYNPDAENIYTFSVEYEHDLDSYDDYVSEESVASIVSEKAESETEELDMFTEDEKSEAMEVDEDVEASVLTTETPIENNAVSALKRPTIEPRRVSLRDFMMQQSTPITDEPNNENPDSSPPVSVPTSPNKAFEQTKSPEEEIPKPIKLDFSQISTLQKTLSQTQFNLPSATSSSFSSPARQDDTSPLTSPKFPRPSVFHDSTSADDKFKNLVSPNINDYQNVARNDSRVESNLVSTNINDYQRFSDDRLVSPNINDYQRFSDDRLVSPNINDYQRISDDRLVSPNGYQPPQRNEWRQPNFKSYRESFPPRKEFERFPEERGFGRGNPYQSRGNYQNRGRGGPNTRGRGFVDRSFYNDRSRDDRMGPGARDGPRDDRMGPGPRDERTAPRDDRDGPPYPEWDRRGRGGYRGGFRGRGGR